MIYFVRHGQTNSNLNKVIAGQQDVPLNEKGIEQAKQTALDLRDVKFDACYCSPLMRAKQTCKQILKYHPDIVPTYDARIQARCYGKVENQPSNSLTFNRWKVGADDEQTKALEIEPIMELYQRVANFFDEITQKHPQQNILVVAHSCIGRIATGYFYGLPEGNDFSTLQISNGKVVIFEK